MSEVALEAAQVHPREADEEKYAKMEIPLIEADMDPRGSLSSRLEVLIASADPRWMIDIVEALFEVLDEFWAGDE